MNPSNISLAPGVSILPIFNIRWLFAPQTAKPTNKPVIQQFVKIVAAIGGCLQEFNDVTLQKAGSRAKITSFIDESECLYQNARYLHDSPI